MATADSTIETGGRPAQDTAQLRQSWDRIARGYDEFVTSTHGTLAEEGLRLAGLGSGMRFLDVAAGSGALSIPAARLGAEVLATDLSPVMLERLEARAAREGVAIETRAMDGHALELEDDSFDVAGSQFGVMLFPDMPQGIREMARVVKPGGRVLMIVFGAPQKVEFFGFFVRAIQAVVPEFTGPPMDPPPLPFQLREPETLRRELGNAGLSDIGVTTTVEELRFATGQEMWDWLVNSNPIVESVLGELELSVEQRDRIRDRLDEMVSTRAGTGGEAVLTSPINIGVATK